MEFEWDENKNKINIAKHNISFVAAGGVLKREDILVKPSSYKNEDRFIAVGPYKGRYITVVYTMRGDAYRIISARAARRKEREDYEEAKGKNR
jgi:uncharacterized DUF497 family protein